MENLENLISQQYSANSKIKNSKKVSKNNSDSKYPNLTVTEVFKNLTDVIPDDDYMPYYVSRFKELGYARFMELANKARKGGKDPQRLFFWMLKNNELVK